MEELARMVAASMARNGCDPSIDHRRLTWSPWFRCELNVDLLLVPSAPGIFALAEEVGALGLSETPANSASPLDSAPSAIPSFGALPGERTNANSETLSASETLGVSEHLPGSGRLSHATKMQAGHDHSRRLLAVFEIGETHDLGTALLRLFAPGGALRARLRSGRCFARFTPVADPAQRHAAATSLRDWLTRSPDVDDKPLLGTGSAA